MKKIDYAIFIVIYATAAATFVVPTVEAPNDTIDVTPVVEAAQESQEATTTTIKLNEALLPVCSCESSGSPKNDPMAYHYEADGVTPLIGRVNSRDRGMCQINLDAHLETTKQMDLDILGDINDYIYYSNWLYETQGLRPWRYSQHCWGV